MQDCKPFGSNREMPLGNSSNLSMEFQLWEPSSRHTLVSRTCPQCTHYIQLCAMHPVLFISLVFPETIRRRLIFPLRQHSYVYIFLKKTRKNVWKVNDFELWGQFLCDLYVCSTLSDTEVVKAWNSQQPDNTVFSSLHVPI